MRILVDCFHDAEIDRQIALAKGREGQAKIIGYIAWRVETPAYVKAFYKYL